MVGIANPIGMCSSWWRHHMETFSALLTLCAGNSPIAGEFPSRRPVTRSFDFFYLGLNKRLSKHSRCWWFETPSRSLWHRCNVTYICFKFNHMSCHLSTLCDSIFAKSPKWQANCQDNRITVLLKFIDAVVLLPVRLSLRTRNQFSYPFNPTSGQYCSRYHILCYCVSIRTFYNCFLTPSHQATCILYGLI